MRNKFQNIILSVIAVMLIITGTLLAASGIVYAGNAIDSVDSNETALFDPNEAALFELINVARKYPLGMAEFLGMDRNQIKKDLPEMADILKTGLPELTIDSRLDQTAKDHAADMLENGYYSYESIDGQSLDERMMAAGYMPSAFGESLGMITFNNFLNPQNAVLKIFKNIYRNELDPAFEGQRNILNPDIKEVGLSFSGGVFNFDNYTANVYMVTCDFGTEIELHDLQLLQLINQARAYPLAVADYYYKNLDGFFDVYPEYYELMESGLPPLGLNLQLYQAAASHAADMAESGYVSHVSPDNQTPAMRLQANGYIPAWMAESIYRMPVYDVDAMQGEITDIFKLIFNGAFKTTGWYDRNLFSAEAMDAGLSVVYQSSAIGSISTNDFQLAVIEYAAQELHSSVAIIGTVYDDLNENELYDAGEGLSGASVSIIESGSEDDLVIYKQMITNPAGGFFIKADPGSYIVQVQLENEEIMQAYNVEVGSASQWLGLEIETKN